MKEITKSDPSGYNGIPRVPKGYIWRRRHGRHYPADHDGDGILYWTYDVFGGKDHGGKRETICLETGNMAEAVAEVEFMCRRIAWPPPGCAMDDDAARLYSHSLTGAVAWHYRNKYLRSLVRIGLEASRELAMRVDAEPSVNSSSEPERDKAGRSSRSSPARSP